MFLVAMHWCFCSILLLLVVLVVYRVGDLHPSGRVLNFQIVKPPMGGISDSEFSHNIISAHHLLIMGYFSDCHVLFCRMIVQSLNLQNFHQIRPVVCRMTHILQNIFHQIECSFCRQLVCCNILVCIITFSPEISVILQTSVHSADS